MNRLCVVNRLSREPISEWVREQLNNWASLWFVPEICQSIEIRQDFNEVLFAQTQVQTGDEHFKQATGNGGVLIRDAQCNIAKLGMLALGLFNTENLEEFDPAQDALDKLEQGIRQDLLSRFMALEPNHIVNPVAKKVEAFSSGLNVLMDISGIHLEIHFDVGLLQTFDQYQTTRSKTPNLASLHSATANRELELNVGLKSAQLTLDELLSIKPGDIIALSHSLDEPVVLATQDSPLNVKAYLVKKEGSKALLLSE